jgi:ABC-2 type transport system permease protein
MLAVLLIAGVGFKIPLGIADPLLFSVSLILTLLSVSALGLIFASAFVLSRSAQALTNGLETPLYIVSGSMFPIALLPFWIHPAAYILGPTWGVDAIRLATSADYASQSFWVGMTPNVAMFLDLAIMMLITLAYVCIAAVLFKMVEKRARITGTMVQA